MRQIGFSLIDNKNKEIQSWYEVGGMRSIPDTITLPNGDIICPPLVYEQYGDYRLVKRMLNDEKPGQWFRHTSSTIEFDGTDIVETFVYPTEPNVVPESVTPLQLRRALNQLNMRATVQDYINTLDSDTQDSWEYAVTFHRSNELINKVAEDLNKTPNEVDDLFRLAASFE